MNTNTPGSSDHQQHRFSVARENFKSPEKSGEVGETVADETKRFRSRAWKAMNTGREGPNTL